jgi:hypothetical protein
MNREAGALEPGALEPGALEPGALEPGALEPGALEPGAQENCMKQFQNKPKTFLLFLDIPDDFEPVLRKFS